ncbi:MAG: YfhO family protein [Ruminococcus flavefaciens]|nr:YfhO family protein [Ruminococcus flavefaciens]MCM1229413.1 YfhO family protein [Ruminococcus flavefaciens]
MDFKKLRNSRPVKLLYDNGVLYFCLSFIIPSVIMLLAFRDENIYPFGDQQMLVVDLWHQYYPFFRVVREKLLDGGSFLYSWENGMGTNFLSLISYYAASPLNWISVFFDDDHIRDSLTYILVAKIGFSGAFFSCFLRYTYNRKDLSIVIFSVMYALCSYTLGYYWNVMWFDTIALFPLVMQGVTAICREGKWKLYTIALALSLLANYYIAFFTCIFTIFMFAGSIIINGKGVKDFFRKLGIIALSSVISIGLSAFMLLPAYLGLKMTYSAENKFPLTVSWYENWADIFANLISYNEPTNIEGLPNFACGMLAVTLFGVFLFSLKIKIREKITTLFMLALIAVSCNMNMLNFIWHGFHATNQLPYRFSFIFSFVLISAGYRAYAVMTNKKLILYPWLIIAPAVVFGLNYYTATKDGKVFEMSTAFRSSLIITVAYILIFIAVRVIPVKQQEIKRAVVNIFICAVVITEFTANASIGVGKVGSSSYNSYPASNENVQEVLDIMREKDNPLFYRCEMTSTYTLNDSALYGYNGVSQFSSSANVSVTRLFKNLGLYSSEAGNRFYYRNSTPVVNMLLGLDYIISKNGMLNNSEYNLERMEHSANVYLYENKYPLSLGFMMDDGILELSASEASNPFEYQNSVMKLATGIDDNIFTAQPVHLVSYDNLEASKTAYGSYTFRLTDKDKSAGAIYSYAGLEDSYLYGYARNGAFESINVRCDGISADNSVSVKDYPVVFPMGNGQAGSVSEVEFKIADDRKTGSYTLMCYALKTNAFERAYEKLADEQLEIAEFTDTEIKGSINALKNGVLYLSIPYEKGWKVWIDGERADTFKVLDSMLGVEVGAGNHEIVLKYTPDGFTLGLIISGEALLALIIALVIENILKKKKAVNTDEESEGDDGLQRDEISRISDTGECPDGAGSAGEGGIEGTEREGDDNGMFED